MTEAHQRMAHSQTLVQEIETAVLAGMHFLAAAKANRAISELKSAIYHLQGLQLIQQSEADRLQAEARAKGDEDAQLAALLEVPHWLQRQAD